MLKRLLLSGAALSVATGMALAQGAPNPAPSPAPAETSAPNAGVSTAAPVAPGVADPAAKADPNLYSNLSGADVIGENDASIGSVADLLIGPSGELRGLVLAHGGLLGVGNTYRQYDVTELPALADGKVKVNLNSAALEGLPQYEYPTAESGRAATSASPGTDPQPIPAPAATELWPASKIVGANVGNDSEKAAISDLRFDGGKVAGVMIDKGSLNLGNKVAEVPFSQLAISGTPAEPKIAINGTVPDIDPAAPAK